MAEEKKAMQKRIKTAIIILSVLLVLSAGALIARVIYLNYFKDEVVTTVVSDNLIGEDNGSSEPNSGEGDTYTSQQASESEVAGGTAETADNMEKDAVIELYKKQPDDNTEFKVENMLPGDTEVKYFSLRLSHHADVKVYFSAEVTKQTKSLSDVLHIKVTHLETAKVLYEGAFADMDENGYGEIFSAEEKTETDGRYKIEVSLPAATGNEYQAAELCADFNWYVKDISALDSPKTGDGNIAFYFGAMCCSLAIIILLLFLRCRKKEGEYAETD